MSIKVEVFSTAGCEKCAKAKDALQSLAEACGVDRVSWQEVDLITGIDRAVELGVMAPGAIVIDGELVFPSSPSPKELRAELARRLGLA